MSKQRSCTGTAAVLDGMQPGLWQEPQQSSRRDAIAVFASAAALLSATPAWALLGIGEGQEKLDAYTSDTVGGAVPGASMNERGHAASGTQHVPEQYR